MLTTGLLGGLHSAKVVLVSLDFAEIEGLQVAGSWDEAGVLLGNAARALELAGADFLVLCTNTMHKVADAITSAVDIPLLHLGDVTASAVLAAGLKTVGLLGTAFTMEQDFYVERLRSHGLEVLIPTPEDRAVVHSVSYDELRLGVVREEPTHIAASGLPRPASVSVVATRASARCVLDQVHRRLHIEGPPTPPRPRTAVQRRCSGVVRNLVAAERLPGCSQTPWIT
jgi:aspartate/glutamate racemase